MRGHIQCSTGPFWAFELEQTMELIAEAGFREVELMVTRDPQTHEPDLPLELARRNGLRITTIHGPFLVVTKTVWGMDPIQKIRRGIDYCRAVGASTFVVHPPHLWERDYARWLREEAADVSAETGVTVAVETMYPKWVAGRRFRVHRWLEPTELVRSCPALVMDTSHLAVGRKDILDAYRILAPKLVHLHLSDNAADGRDGHLGLEQGVLPVDRLLSELRENGYSGGLALELAMTRFLERPNEAVELLKQNREYVLRRLERKRRVEKGLPRG
jgi:sugar phosphate isomerase/epimerase